MKDAFPVIYVARHGNTAWIVSGQHTGHTDLPLSPSGEINASRLVIRDEDQLSRIPIQVRQIGKSAMDHSGEQP